MAQYQVPQFIETEAKIIGPFTFKQFLYILVGGIILFVVQNFVSVGTLVLIAIPVGLISLALAFLRINGVPLPNYIVMALSFSIGGKKYLYKKGSDEDIVKQILSKK